MKESSKDDPIVALATPPGRSAIALVRGSGVGSLELLGRLFDRPERLASTPGHGSVIGHLLDRKRAEGLDQVSILVYRAPRSYTGEDGFEIGCHGNPGGVRRIIDELLGVGFRPAEPGEFTLRAFLAGKLDLTQAEAVHELVTARTDRGRRLALARLEGSVRRRIDAVKGLLAELMVQVNVQLDYGEDEVGEMPLDGAKIDRALGEIRRLLASYRSGRLYQVGATVVLAGAPNVGKSSLFNALVAEERAITDPTPGTTRDYLEVSIDINGIPVRLFDTAGIRESEEGIEVRGMAHTNRLIAQADLVIRLADAREGLSERSVGGAETPEIVVYNKADLLSAQERGALEERISRRAPGEEAAPLPLLVSATTHDGLQALEASLTRELLGSDGTGEALLDSPRQKALLDEAAGSLEAARRGLEAGTTIDLVAEDLQGALDALGQITGEISSADLLEQMFSSFCLGK